MTKKRWLVFVEMLACLLCVGIAVALMLPSGPGVTKANFNRVEKGMTKAEVEAIFGVKGDWPTLVDFPEKGALGTRYWWGAFDDSSAYVVFEKQIVCSKEWHESTIIEKIRCWLNLRRELHL